MARPPPPPSGSSPVSGSPAASARCEPPSCPAPPPPPPPPPQRRAMALPRTGTISIGGEALLPTGRDHGRIEARLAAKLLAWAEASGEGEVRSGRVGIYTRRNPDSVRATDLLFLSAKRLGRAG